MKLGKKQAAQWFYGMLQDYRDALRSKDPARIVAASLRVHAARRNRRGDNTLINRAFNSGGMA